MGDWTLPPCLTLLVGMTGSGKSTFAYRYLLNAMAACRFIFDDLGRASVRLNMRPCYTAAECEAALASRWVVFNPARAFPSDYKAAFAWFCKWVYDVSLRGPGKKYFLADEIWQWQSSYMIPPELAKVVQAGREENIEFVCCTQMPQRINASITGQSTELVCFRLDEKNALDAVQELGADRDAVQKLPLFSFVSWNRVSGGRLSGSLSG
jgi:hypothetical protein